MQIETHKCIALVVLNTRVLGGGEGGMVMAISQSFIALLREVFQCFVTLFINGLAGKSHCLIIIIKGNIKIR